MTNLEALRERAASLRIVLAHFNQQVLWAERYGHIDMAVAYRTGQQATAERLNNLVHVINREAANENTTVEVAA